MAPANLKAGSTLDNLLAAFGGESNANAKYLAFAAKADEEGYAGAASLFRAAARAEEIHAARHAVEIKKLGGEPHCEIAPPPPGTTAENLAAAIAGETYERDVMYPAFIEVAKSEGRPGAEKACAYALAAEAEHAKLYGEALANLDSWREPRTFYVCPVCGYTTEHPDFDDCPVCRAARAKFEGVG
ncbi:MAG: hypothetical protein HRF49_10810 [bacterium]|jgi:rubrerythrin